MEARHVWVVLPSVELELRSVKGDKGLNWKTSTEALLETLEVATGKFMLQPSLEHASHFMRTSFGFSSVKKFISVEEVAH
jgi:hypothetical protein